MGDNQILETDDKTLLMNEVRKRGGSIGNTSLRQALNWEWDRYWATRNALYDEGLLEIGKGRGGSVRLSRPELAIQTSVPEPVEAETLRETSTYESILQQLDKNWLRQEGFDEYVVEICAHQGRKQTGGKWTRPDLIMVAVESYEFLPRKRLSVYSFEVKLADALDITAVYEAASHRRSVHCSFLLVVGKKPPDDQVDNLADVCDEQGIGLILAENAADHETWEEVVTSTRNEPQPRDLNAAIANFAGSVSKDKIRKWIK